MCNRILLHFSLEQLLLNSVHSNSVCCNLEGRIKSYKLFIIFCSGFLCSRRVMGPRSGFPAGLVHLGHFWSKPKWKQDLSSSQADPAHTSLSPSCSTLKLFDLLLPEPFSSSIPQSADPCRRSCPSCCPLCTVQPPPPPASSLLALLHLLMSSKPFSCLIPASGYHLTTSSASTSLHMIQPHFSPMIKYNGQMGAQRSPWRGFALILGFPCLCSFVCGYPLLCSRDF